MNCKAILPRELSIEDVDLCVLLGNLLDNAIEGAENAPGEKYVRLKIRAFNSGFTVIRVENSYARRYQHIKGVLEAYFKANRMLTS